jgi:flagella basal body P-ring formation protein FlgA
VLLLVCASAGPAGAAELRLRPGCRCAGPLVTLGDVAEVVASNEVEAASLRAIELFPAPTPPGQRYVRVREIQDLLLLRGVNLAGQRFSGSARVLIRPEEQPAETAPIVPRSVPLADASRRRAQRRLEESIVAHLQSAGPVDVPWQVQVEPSEEQARWLADPRANVSVAALPGAGTVEGGRRQFQVAVETPDESTRFTVEAEVTAAPAVVVSVESLPRGVLVRATDVALVRLAPEERREVGLRSLDEVVGKETVRAIPKGKPIAADWVRAPLLVRRGDVVTVSARAGGVCVRTMARARDDGSLGELVAVESLAGRATYYARVAGPNEVEVHARAARAPDARLSGPAGTVIR